MFGGFAAKVLTAPAIGAGLDAKVSARRSRPSRSRAELAKTGLVAFGKINDSGFRQITTSTKPIRTPADLASLKIRVPPAAL